MTVEVSVIVVAFNAAATIEAALSSLLKQRFELPYEIVVVDDASTDRTSDIVLGLGDPRIVHIRLRENVGRAQARNLAVEMASGEIIVVADADDISFPDRLEHHWSTLHLGKSSVSGGNVVDLVDDVLLSTSTLVFPRNSTELDRVFGDGQMGIAHPASSFRRAWFTNQGGYDPNLRWCEDYDLFARGWQPGLYHASPQILLGYRRSRASGGWSYWWQNQVHVRAINLRIAHDGRGAWGDMTPIANYIADASAFRFRAFELVRFLVFKALGDIRHSSRSAREKIS